MCTHSILSKISFAYSTSCLRKKNIVNQKMKNLNNLRSKGVTSSELIFIRMKWQNMDY